MSSEKNPKEKIITKNGLSKKHQYKIEYGGQTLIIETGEMAQLADSAVTCRYGDTVVLATVVAAPEPKETSEFFPMLVDYEEKLYAAGKISGSRFIKREGRPSDNAVLTARLIDRPLRPLFPKNYRNDLQIIVTVLSVDLENDPDIVAIIAASCALTLAPTPFKGPVGAARVGIIEGKFILNPTNKQLENSALDLVVAGTKEKVMMLEGGGNEISEKVVEEAIEFGQAKLQPVIQLQEKIKKEFGKKEESKYEEEFEVHKAVKKFLGEKLATIISKLGDKVKEEKLKQFKEEVLINFEGSYKQVDLEEAFEKILEDEVRKAILTSSTRPDGRKPNQIRAIDVKVGVLPRTHGSALFTRGQTQVLTATTLGAPGEEQVIETMEEEATKRYMHHYNFPPYSTGEIRPMRTVSRREIGHGSLAERALQPVIPTKEKFPYTIRLVSEVLSSNGSSSMAAVCGSTLSLMDAGVPISAPIAGVAMGLITEKSKGPVKKYKILTDIQGIEDFAGDMDFKIAGSTKGITSIQLDIKLPGLDQKIISEALQQAKEAREVILQKMHQVIPAPRPNLSKYAPTISVIKINPDKIRDVIGPGGRVINKIIAQTNVSIDIEDDGTVLITSENGGSTKDAVEWIRNLTHDVKVGEVFMGRVTKILDFGAFVEILPGQEGLVHISQLADHRVHRVTDIVKVGDIIPVMVVEIDPQGRINLSHKAAKGYHNKRNGKVQEFGQESKNPGRPNFGQMFK